MNYAQLLGPNGPTLTGEALIVFILLLIWGLAWKGAALWISARQGQKWWFIVLLIVNSFGILEIIYLIFVAKVRSFRGLTMIDSDKQ